MSIIKRIISRIKGKRFVRIHMQEPSTGLALPSFEGLLEGRWGGHYHLSRSKMLQAEDHSTVTGEVSLPAAKVVFVQTVTG